MVRRVEAARAGGDSVGGIVECRVNGLPPGLGDPVFDKLDAELAHAVLSIGATKGIEFGAGFGAADMQGSEIEIRVDVRVGQERATAWTCEFTAECVAINADYRS